MVHALNNVRHALVDHGLLVDLHPQPHPRDVICDTPDGRQVVGHLRGPLGKYRAAEARLARMVHDGLFRLCHSEAFHLLHYTASLQTLRAYVACRMSSRWIDRATERRITRLASAHALRTIIIDEPIRISVLEKT